MCTVTRHVLLSALAAATLAGWTTARADDVDLIQSSPFGTSWDRAASWSNNAPASAGNDYHVGRSPYNGFYLRTPNNAGNPTFPGDSLTLHSTGSLALKHNGTVTITDLRLDGGSISASTGNRTMAVGGNLRVDSDSTFNHFNTGNRRDMRLRSTLSGSGNLILKGNSNPSIFRFSADPAAYTGALVVENSLDRLHVEDTAGSTVTVKGTGAGLNWAPFEQFAVGVNGGTATVISPGGQAVNLGNGSGLLAVGRRDTNVGGSTPTQFTGTLDVSGATSFTANVGTLGVGYVSGGGGGQGYPTGTLILSPDNTITADSIVVADSRRVGLGGKTNQVTFGAMSNVSADTVVIGGSKGRALADIVPGGVLNLGGKSGARATMLVGDQPVSTAGGSRGTADFSAGTINAMLDDLILAQKVSGAGAATTGEFTMAAGTVDVNNVLLANRIGGGGGPATGTFNLQGGTLTAGTIDDGGNGGTAIFNFTGGVLHVDNFGFTLNQNGGTLAAGDSPSTTNIAADYRFNNGALEVEIDGYAQGTDYDFYDVVGNAFLGNDVLVPSPPDGPAILQVLLPGGFPWVEGDTFDVLEASQITIATDFVLDSSATGGRWLYEVVGENNREVLRLTAVTGIIPEPGTLAIWALLGALGLAAGWRRRARG